MTRSRAPGSSGFCTGVGGVMVPEDGHAVLLEPGDRAPAQRGGEERPSRLVQGGPRRSHRVSGREAGALVGTLGAAGWVRGHSRWKEGRAPRGRGQLPEGGEEG